jgi:hypothetical protein
MKAQHRYRHHLPRLALALLSAWILAACASNQPQERQPVAAASSAFKGVKWSKHPWQRFRTLALVPKSQADEKLESHEVPPSSLTPGGVQPFATHINLDGPDNFTGSSRKHAKTSLVAAPVEQLLLSDLVSQLEGVVPNGLEKDTPGLAKKKRVAAEKRNVQVEGWLHFYKLEPDRDFHLIVGTHKDYAQGKRFTVEISGVNPQNPGSKPVLQDVRSRFKEGVRDTDNLDWGGSYVRIPPTPVRITGALFCDTEHWDGVGPQGWESSTNWEIHPATDIEFGQPQ